MLHNNRIITKISGTLTDHSVQLSEFDTGASTIAITTSDALYLGSDYPFNHRYIEIGTANDQASSISVSLWSGTAWVSAVDVIDQTKVSGACLAQSGIISWVPDRDQTSWSPQANSKDISDLSTTRIYDLYWVKLTFSGDLKASTSLKYVGHKFSTDAQLETEYPDLLRSDLMTAFKAGKTNWLEQTIGAAEYIVQSLREKGIIISRDQILDWSLFQRASIHKTAEIIMSAFGEDYRDAASRASGRYKNSLDLKAYSVDQDKNAQLTPKEKAPTTEWLTR